MHLSVLLPNLLLMDGTVLGVEVLVWFGLEFIFVCLGFGVFGFFFPVGFF